MLSESADRTTRWDREIQHPTERLSTKIDQKAIPGNSALIVLYLFLSLFFYPKSSPLLKKEESTV